MKLKIKLLGLMFFLGGFLNHIIAQNISITGKVKNKTTGEALVGATVGIEKTTKSTQTDGSGNFSISAAKGSTLIISFVGYSSSSYKVNKGENITISLEEVKSNLEEVVVVGYGTQKITKVSGAISTVKSADIEKINAVRTEDALQGRASGVNVIQGGSPGSAPTVFIRGITSFGGLDPTVIIDGVPQSLVDFNSINASDIESISVLKDAAATAIYGVKGGNGVIVVTTKTGRKNQKTAITFNSSYGVQEVVRKIGVLNATEYAAMVNEGSTLSGGSIIFPNLSTVGKGTNWQDQIFHSAPLQSYNISARGGSDKMTYFLSGAYLSQGGIVGGYDKSRFNRGNFTANLNFDIAPKTKFIVDVSGVVLNSKAVAENSFNSIIGSALNFDPTVPVYNTVPNTVGKYGFSNLLTSEVFNPLTLLDNTYNENSGTKVYGKFEFQYDVLKNLKLTARYGYTKYDGLGKSFNPLVFYGIGNKGNTMDADGSTTIGAHNSVANSKSSNFNWTSDFFANYNFSLKEKHHFETVIGLSIAKTSGNAAGTNAQDVPFNSWDYADYTAATSVNTATNPNARTAYYYEYFNKHISYFGRLNYDYNDKYLASILVRRDGSNTFGANNKFGTFSAASLGWVVSKENFFKSKLINFLKIRGSYGSIGNDNNISPEYVQIITGGSSYATPANSNGYTFGDVFYPGSTLGSAVNKGLRWEKQLQMNVGFDVTFLKNKLTLSADYFEKKVDGLLFIPTASLYLGTIPVPYGNIGNTKTSGLDLTLGYNSNIGKLFKINTTLTFTTSKNLVVATNEDGTANYPGPTFFNGQNQTVTYFAKGQAPGYFYGYKTAGLFQTAAEVAASPTQNGAQPGDIKFVDVNGDGKIDANDRTNLGNPFPKFTMGWNLNLEYKNLDLTVFTYISYGNKIYRAYERNSNYTNLFRSVLGRWTGAGTTNDANTPRYSFTDANNNVRASDRYIEDGSFIKIKNIQLGYTFPASITNKFLNKLRVYIQIKNALTFTKYSGFDPEISGGVLGSGLDLGAYPQSRTYAFGIDIKL